MKKIFRILVTLFALAIAAFSIYAADYVYDQGNLLVPGFPRNRDKCSR